jgi:hypothetical protein
LTKTTCRRRRSRGIRSAGASAVTLSPARELADYEAALAGRWQFDFVYDFDSKIKIKSSFTLQRRDGAGTYFICKVFPWNQTQYNRR